MVTIVEIFYCAHQFRCAIENCGYSNISDNQVGMQFNCLEGLQNLKNVYLKTSYIYHQLMVSLKTDQSNDSYWGSGLEVWGHLRTPQKNYLNN